jgi:tRNA threonylcarbamoyladenosine biosynthesis protein TsaB
MRYLAIDTSGPALIVVLGSGGEPPVNCTTAHFQDGQPGHIESLSPVIARAFAETGWTAASLDGIIVSAGPGSFTGLRIAWATAKGIALAGDIPLIPVATLEAIALGSTSGKSYPPGTMVIALTDARKGRWYTGIFSVISPVALRRVADDMDIPLVAVAQEVDTCISLAPASPVVVGISEFPAGDDFARIRQHKPGEVSPIVKKIDPQETGAGLLTLGSQRHGDGAIATDYAGPTYLRGGDIGKPRSGPTFSSCPAGEK